MVTHPLSVQEVPGSIPGPGKVFYVSFFAFLLLCFYFFCQKTHYLSQKFAISYNVNLFSILNILQDL